MTTIVVHYHEIALKGDNRPFFEQKLATALERTMAEEALDDAVVERLRDRFRIQFPDPLPTQQLAAIRRRLRFTPGVAYAAITREAEQSLDAIEKTAWDLVADETFQTFRVTTKRSQKEFALTSEDINRDLGSFLVEQLEEARGEHPHKIVEQDGTTHWGWVDLEHPDITVFVEIANDRAALYTDHDRIDGPGGLPVSTAGTLVSLISSGIDSPIAAYRMMVRGARCVFVHIHSYPYTSKESQEDVEQLVRTLAQVQGKSTLYMVPFGEVQQKLVDAGHPKLRLLLYRRLFLRIAERVAQQENALGLVTGESLGQVASQTLENMQAVETIATLPVYRPLIGRNKEDIIAEARTIGTYETSVASGDDCCSLFLPDHPATKATPEELNAIEKELPVEEWVDTMVEETSTCTIDGGDHGD